MKRCLPVRSLIVGIDAGITVGIAILNTKGEIVDLTSKKEAKRSEIIRHILKFGRPVIVASDVNPLPKIVERLASSLGSKVYFPEVSLSNVEKIKIIGDYNKEIKDSHQKDALAAALKAFKNYHELFLKVEETLEKLGKECIFDEVVKKLLEAKTENVADVVRKIMVRGKR